MTKGLDMESLRKTMVEAMVQHFTADELTALADFYGSPIGKSAMKKFGPYMAEVMPKFQADLMKAFTQFMQEERQASRQIGKSGRPSWHPLRRT